MKKLIKVLSNCLPLFLLLSSAISTSAFYDPQAQRWINRDPVEEAGGVNLHSYVGNDPTDRGDTLGLYDGNFNRPAETVTFNTAPLVLFPGGQDFGPVPVGQSEADYNPGPRLEPDEGGATLLDLAGSFLIPIPGAEETAIARIAMRQAAKRSVACNAAKMFSKEKQALIDMAKADKRMGMTKADMEAYKNLNKQLPDPFPANKVRGPEVHPNRGPTAQQPHGHVGPVDYIPIRGAN